MEAQLERFNTERKELFTKIETLNTTLTSKDRELTIVKNKYESQIEEIEKKKKNLDEMKAEMTGEKQKLNEKIESLR
jgi:predicted  nucleic acid-binding Zn-ribbon protein